MVQILTSPISGIVRDHQYPYATLWINGRTVTIEEILHDREASLSPFEESTFSFIKEWLSGQENFQLTTSGSTGEPRSISIQRAQMIASALRTSEKINLQRDFTALVCIDTKYIGGKMMLVRCLTLGMRIMAVDPVANPLIKIPVDKCVQFTAFVPYQVSSVLESKHPHLLNNLDKVLIGGAPLNENTAAQLMRYQCEFYETYGMTETISHIALRLVNTKMKQPYFEVLPGVNVSRDDRGCLVVTADYLTGPVTTNDIVDIVAPGKFVWLGRWDRVINSGGVKVMAEKLEQVIETAFHKHNLSNRFFIAALPDEKLGNRIVLVLEGVQISSELLNAALASLKSAVSAYEFPKEVYSIPEFIQTETQKVDRIKTLKGITLHSSLK